MKEFDRIIRFVKDWTLLVCMALGAVGYMCSNVCRLWRHGGIRRPRFRRGCCLCSFS